MLYLYTVLVILSLGTSYFNPRPYHTYDYYPEWGLIPNMLFEAFIGAAVVTLVVFTIRALYRLVFRTSRT